MRPVLQDGDEPTVVVADSCSGITTSEAAAGEASMRHLLMIASYPPEVGRAEPVDGRGGRVPPTALDYLVCAQDRGTPEQREFARRASSVVELDAGHHPFLSQPAAVRGQLLGAWRANSSGSC